MVDAVYIHIPFCSSICTYCDFPKVFYNNEWVNKYLESLEDEIKLKYKNKLIKTIYIGGGTPSCLNIEQLNKLMDIIKIFRKDVNCEISFECNIESIDESKLNILYENNINRLSIGVQTFNKKFIDFLGRHHTKEEVFDKINLIKKIGFTNISIDLMYAFPGETLDDLNYDLDNVLELDIPHVSTYSLIIEPNTIIYNKGIKNIDEDIDASMYELIEKRLNNYEHYEISNFGKEGFLSNHNLVYWNNNHYYGFGMGASSYLENIRSTNTRNIINYINGKNDCDSHELDINETIENEFILGFRKINGINKSIFNKKYNIDINDIEIVKNLIKRGQLIDDGDRIYIKEELIYVSNTILVNFIGENYGKK